MKRVVAIVLSLILIGIQAMAAVQIVSNSGAADQCGSTCCKTRCCCVTESAESPHPLPTATPPVVVVKEFSAVLSVLIVWTLPDSARSQIFSPVSAPSLATALPLFERDCALLI